MGNRKFIECYLFCIYWTVVWTEQLMGFICFRYTGQLRFSEHLMCLTILDIVDNSGNRTFDTFYLFQIYPTIVRDATFDGLLSALDVLDNCGGPNI